MNKMGKKLVVAGLCLGLAMGTVTGCSSNSYAGKAVATLDGEDIDYALVNFTLRYNQAEMQTMYGSWFGDDLWTSYGSSVKSNVMDNVKQMLILEKHMDDYGVTITDEEKEQITETATEFMESNDKATLNAMTATQEIVERMLTLTLIQNKMQTAIIADADTEVSDEEAAQKKVQYVFFSTADTTDDDGNTVELTDDELAALKEEAEQVLEAVKAGTDMDEAAHAVDENLASSTTTYGTDNGSIDDTVKEAVDSLSDGEVADSVIETDDGYYVAMMVSTFDEDATETQRESIISQRQSDLFDEVYDAWEEELDYTEDEDLLDAMDFTDTFEVKETETETSDETEAQTDTETETVTEAAETETAAE
jgi:hypothetical protein